MDLEMWWTNDDLGRVFVTSWQNALYCQCIRKYESILNVFTNLRTKMSITSYPCLTPWLMQWFFGNVQGCCLQSLS